MCENICWLRWMAGLPFTLINSRRWIRFGLRTLFLAVTAICVWLGLEAQAVRRQALAVDAIERAGGSVVFDERSSAQWLSYLAGPEYFRTASDITIKLHPETSTRDGDGLQIIAYQMRNLPTVRRLNLSIDDSDLGEIPRLLSHLRDFPNLKDVFVVVNGTPMPWKPDGTMQTFDELIAEEKPLQDLISALKEHRDSQPPTKIWCLYWMGSSLVML